MISAKKEDKRLPPLAADLSSQSSLGKVAGSIHSLRERLQEVSLEQIVEADEKLKTSVSRLLVLQKMLTTLTEMKQSIASTKEQISAEAFDTGHASNLIRFPAPNRLSRDLVQESGHEFVLLDKRSGGTESLQTAQPTNTITESPSPAVDQTAILASEKDIQSADPTQSLSRNSATHQFAMGKQDDKPEENSLETMHGPVPPKDDVLCETEANCSAELGTTDNRPDSPTKTRSVVDDFDQRLLHDLIKDYGEFVASPNLPAATEQHKTADRTNSQTSHSSAPSRSKEHAAANNLPSHRHQGELDRKLKKLIKDYGEYDLYSHQTPSKLRRGVLAAFLLLAAVFSTIYFLSGPKSNAPSTQSSATESEDAIGRASPGLLTGAEIEGAVAPKRRGSASVETPQATETGEPSALKNKTVPKKKITKAGPDS